MPRNRNPYRLATFWSTGSATRTVEVDEVVEVASTAPAATVDSLRFGYTLNDLDRIARTAVQIRWTMAMPSLDRYSIAWSAIVEALYSAETPPSNRDLVAAGQAAIRNEVRSIHRTFGLPLDGEHGGHTHGVAVYWWLNAAPAASPERPIVDRQALAAILPLLAETGRQALLAVAAADGDRSRAAEALGVSSRVLLKRLTEARAMFLRWWHEHEAPSTVWRESRRLGVDDLVPCGTPAAYHRHRRRGEPTCEPCRRAVDAQRKARAAGGVGPP